MEDDYCIVCAEPLEWVAYAINCGHKDACSKCVARLRFVMKDTRCLLCQQLGSAVVVTRSLGAFTPTIPPKDSDKLKDRSRAGELYHLPSVDGYFDDLQHYQFIKALCSYTHPALAEAGQVVGAKLPRFASLKELRRHLEEHLKLQFCTVCLEGRKVFISEQMLYSKEELKQHTKVGDVTGPLAESGFRGHPQCRFCRRSFYGDNELFAHMQQNHEQCHLCRRARPDKYIYYRDYAELDEHFSKDHFPCGHPACMEAKFVVFGTEQELKKHKLSEHKADLESLSRHERRAALTIPIDLHYRRGGAEDPGTEGVDIRGPGRPGITIGGGGAGGGAEGSQSRFRARGGSGGTAEQRHMADAMQASLESSQRQHASAPAPAPAPAAAAAAAAGPPPGARTFRDEDFPAASSSSAGASSSAAPRWAAAANGGMGGSALRSNDFPELPGTTKAAKRRNQKKKTLVEQLAAAGGGVRVLHRADNGSRPPAAQPSGGLDRFPRLTHSASEVILRAPSAADTERPFNRSAGLDFDYEAPRTQEVAPPRPEVFPALPAARSRAAGAAGSGRTLSNALTARPLPAATAPVFLAQDIGARRLDSSGSGRPPPARASAGRNEFPSLSGWSDSAPMVAAPASYMHRSNSAGSVSSSASGRGSGGLPTDSFPSLTSSRVSPTAPAAAVAVQAASSGGPSEGLRRANKALIEKARRQLSESDFAAFKQDSGLFMAGRLPAATLHSRIQALGVASLVPDLAALCPDAEKRKQLLQVHRDTFQSPTPSGKRGQGWVPPEAAAAAAAHAERHCSWACPACTLMNAPEIGSCEACTHSRPDDITSAQATGSSDAAGDKAAIKPKKVPKFDRLRLTGGDPDATREWLNTRGGTAPGSAPAWGGDSGASQQRRQALAVQPGQPRGPWARQGQLATEMRVINDAYGKNKE